MLTIRKRYENNQKTYFKNLYEEYGSIPENHMQAIYLRQKFFIDNVLAKRPVDYQTNIEKDWAYIARRVYKD